MNLGGSIHPHPRFDPWVGKTPWRRAWQPTLVLVPGENPMDRGTWRATVHWVPKSWTRLKHISMHTHSPLYTWPLQTQTSSSITGRLMSLAANRKVHAQSSLPAGPYREGRMLIYRAGNRDSGWQQGANVWGSRGHVVWGKAFVLS